MRTGDILLFSSPGLSSGMIEHFTDSLWSHASILLVLKDCNRGCCQSNGNLSPAGRS